MVGGLKLTSLNRKIHDHTKWIFEPKYLLRMRSMHRRKMGRLEGWALVPPQRRALLLMSVKC